MCQFHDKTAFSHTYFDLDGVIVAKNLVPAAFMKLWFLDHIGACLQWFLLPRVYVLNAWMLSSFLNIVCDLDSKQISSAVAENMKVKYLLVTISYSA